MIKIILGGLFIYLIAPWIIQQIALRKEILANYLIPFKTWCRDLYKELTEFKGRYNNIAAFDELSKSLIIIDFRELHEVLKDEGKYRCKIEKENEKSDKDIANYLMELDNLVDNIWHSLQDEYSVNFCQKEYDVWIDAIIKYPKKNDLVNSIKIKSNDLLAHLKKDEFDVLIDYLLQQTPEEWFTKLDVYKYLRNFINCLTNKVRLCEERTTI